MMIHFVWILFILRRIKEVKNHAKRFMRYILDLFQIIIHSLPSFLGFIELMSKELGLETIKPGFNFTNSFYSSNLNVNCQPVVISCFGGCGQKISGYKRYVCPKGSTRFSMENVDLSLIELNESLRIKKKSINQVLLL